MSWDEVLLIDKLELIIDYRGKTPKKSKSGVVTLSAKSVKMGYIDYSKAYYISQETYKQFMVRGFPKKGDILITTEAPLGCIAKLNREDVSLAQRLLTLRANGLELNNDYLMCFLMSPRGQFELKSRATGTTVQGIKKAEFEKVKILLPPIQTQKRIADILNAYDDLIENNLKRIKLLEQAAQNIYKEWFVNLRFPGHENTPINEETGLPEGWEEKMLKDLCHLTMGQSPKSEYYNLENEGLPFHQGVTGYGNRFVTHSTYCKKITRIAEEGDILCSVRAPVGRLNISPSKLIIGRGLSAIRNKNGFQSFQFCQLKNHFYQEDMIGGGAIFNSVTKKVLEEQKLLSPDIKTQEGFEKIVIPLDNQIVNLDAQNQKLKVARDILLPRLMNRTIEV